MKEKEKKDGKFDAKPKRKRRTVQNKARSVKQWIQGLEAGTIDKTIKYYYDNAKDFESVIPGIHQDPAKMSKIKRLEHYNHIQESLKAHQHGDSKQKEDVKK